MGWEVAVDSCFAIRFNARGPVGPVGIGTRGRFGVLDGRGAADVVLNAASPRMPDTSWALRSMERRTAGPKNIFGIFRFGGIYK